MDSIYIKTANITSNYLEISLETLLIVNIFSISDSNNIKLNVLLDEKPSKPLFRVYLNANKYHVIAQETVPVIATYCVWPVIVVENTVVAGLCSVSRQIIKSSRNKEVESLLGFREACLMACSESSIWTKFCEVDMIQTVKDVFTKLTDLKGKINYVDAGEENSDNLCGKMNGLTMFTSDCCKKINEARSANVSKKDDSIGDVCEKINDLTRSELNADDCTETNVLTNLTSVEENDSFTDCINIPVDLTRFEYHMQQPVRIHNVYKVAREKNKCKDIKSSVPLKDLNIPHCYSEGPYLTLADTLLYPCIHLLVQTYTEKVVKEELPLTYIWYKNMECNKVLSGFKIEVVGDVNINLKGKLVVQEEIPQESLYSSDPNRYKPQSRIYTKQTNIEHSLNLVDQSEIGVENLSIPYGHDVDFNWKDVPLAVNPEGGSLPKSRSHRKCQQLENLTKAVLKICKNNSYTIVDFCSGSGHLGLLLAVLLPECQIVLVENKERSLIRAKETVTNLGLTNVVLLQCNLDYFQAKFNLGVSLHACGVATDLVIQNCILNQAHFVSCPCCYGGIHDCYHLQYPRSEFYRGFISYGNYLHLAHAADQTHDSKNVKTKQGYKCMDVIDTDRKLYAEKCGYVVYLGKLMPTSCTPKNNLIVGIFK